MRKRAGTNSWFGDKVYHTMADVNHRQEGHHHVQPRGDRPFWDTQNHQEDRPQVLVERPQSRRGESPQDVQYL
jgi:hypothetical protein